MPKVTQQRSGRIGNNRISSSAPSHIPDLYSIPLLLRTHQPFSSPGVVKGGPSGAITCGFRKSKFLLNPLGYETCDPKEWVMTCLYFFGPSWILNIWDVLVHNFKLPGAGHVELGTISSSKDMIDYGFPSPTSKLVLNNKAQSCWGRVGGRGFWFHPHFTDGENEMQSG